MIFQFHLLPEVYVFTKSLNFNKHSLLSFNESNYNTSIIEKSKAIKLNIDYTFESRCIKLLSKTKLTDVGISSKITFILASNNIACNIISGYENDYFFVPFSDGLKAYQILNTIS
tara:strand:- start:215 stop:559 length:345 start_codon:yes stop_codon:yes gene_type:complete